MNLMNTTPPTVAPEDDFLHPTTHAHIREARERHAAGTADLRGTVRPMVRATVHAPTARMASAHRADLSDLSPVAAMVVALHKWAK